MQSVCTAVNGTTFISNAKMWFQARTLGNFLNSWPYTSVPVGGRWRLAHQIPGTSPYPCIILMVCMVWASQTE
jgi:hypothetical protein